MTIEEKIKALLEYYTDACSMCISFEKCEECQIPDIIEKLKEVLYGR